MTQQGKKMKKLFGKSEGQFDAHQHCIGKTFNVGRYNVVVEETIAEGKILL